MIQQAYTPFDRDANVAKAEVAVRSAVGGGKRIGPTVLPAGLSGRRMCQP